MRQSSPTNHFHFHRNPENTTQILLFFLENIQKNKHVSEEREKRIPEMSNYRIDYSAALIDGHLLQTFFVDIVRRSIAQVHQLRPLSGA